MSDQDLLAQTVTFERDLVARVSTRLVPFAWGTAYLNDGYRERWDSNFLWVDESAARESISGEELAAEADRVLGQAGLSIGRSVSTTTSTGSIAAALTGLGYGGDRLVVMALRREPDRPSMPGSAEEVDVATLRPALEIVLGREPWASSPETVRMLADFRKELARHAGARFFCARVGNEIASMCELYRHAAIAQVEDVNTLEEFRNRGLARAVVQLAVDEARSAGADLVFIHALDDDWPKQLYAKLGFDPIGFVWSFVKPSAPLKSPA